MALTTAAERLSEPVRLDGAAELLAGSGRLRELDELLRTEVRIGDRWASKWFTMLEDAGRAGRYAVDVGRARTAHEKLTDAQLAQSGGTRAPNLGRELGYALLAASARSIDEALPPELLRCLVRTGVWSVDQALRQARAAQSAPDRVAALAALIGCASDGERTAVTVEALDAIPTIAGSYDQFTAIRILVAELSRPGAARPAADILLALLDTAASIDGDDDADLHRWLALDDVGELLAGRHLDRQHAAADRILDPGARVSHLIKLAHTAAGPDQGRLASEALALADGLESVTDRAARIIEAAPLLPGGVTRSLARRTLALIDAIDEERTRARRLAELAELTSGVTIARILLRIARLADPVSRVRASAPVHRRAPAFQLRLWTRKAVAGAATLSDGDRSAVLAILAPFAPRELVAPLIELACGLASPSARAERLIELLRGQPQPDYSPKLGLLFAAIEDEKPNRRKWLLTKLTTALALTQAQFDRVLALVESLPEPLDRVETYAHIAGQARDHPQARAVVTARAMADLPAVEHRSSRLVGIARIADHLNSRQARDALALARNVQDGRSQTRALTSLALDGDAPLEDVIRALDAMGSAEDRHDGVLTLARHGASVSGEQRGALHYRLRAVGEDEGEGDRYVSGLLTRIEQSEKAERAELVAELVDLVRRRAASVGSEQGALFGDGVFENALLTVVGESPSHTAEMLGLAKSITDDHLGTLFLLQVVKKNRAGRDHPALVLDVVRDLPTEAERGNVLPQLAEYFDEEHQAAVLESVRAFEDPAVRASAFMGLSFRRSGQRRDDLITEALLATESISDRSKRAQTLAEFCGRVTATPAVRAAAVAAVDLVDDNQRAHLLIRLGREVYGDDPAVLRRGFAVAKTLSDPTDRFDAMLEAVKYRDRDSWTAVAVADLLAAITAVPGEGDRAQRFADLASSLITAEFDDAVTAARSLGSPVPLARALSALLPLAGDRPRSVSLFAEILGLLDIVSISSLTPTDRQAQENQGAEVLVALLPHADADDVVRILETAARVGGHAWSSVLRAPGLVADGLDAQRAVAMLREVTRTALRPELLAILAAAVPVIHRVAGRDAVGDCVKAVRDATAWWP